MPGFVGAVQIVNISSAAVFNIGDVFQIHPNFPLKNICWIRLIHYRRLDKYNK